MAFPRKKLRSIMVGNQQFAWVATGNDEFISLNIAPLGSAGQVLYTNFSYYSRVVAERQDASGRVIGRQLRQQLVVTPYIVRQVIEYGLQHGWQPGARGHLSLFGIERHLDLRLGSGGPPALS